MKARTDEANYNSDKSMVRVPRKIDFSKGRLRGSGIGMTYDQSRDEFRADLQRGLEAVETATGVRAVGYRAPAFSITRDSAWAYEELAAADFEYDSSQYDSPRVPRRLEAIPRVPYRLRTESGAELWELPVAYALAHLLGFGATGVFWSIAVAYSTMALVSVALFRRGRWKQKKV